MSAKDFIPVNTPVLGNRERELVLECLESGWISSEGPWIACFEENFANRMDRKHGVAVANGSAALDVAVAALRIAPGDEVILPSFTIISCAAAILRQGGVPVCVDCDPVTWNMDVASIEARITPRTKAIMAVHIYGLPVDMGPLLAIAKRHGLFVIEDAAEAHGLTYKGRPCGSFGDVSTFSFYPNKLVTTGEGGMVLTDDPDIAERCRTLRNLCFQTKRRFVHEEIGWNYRMASLQAALGIAQLEKLDETLRIKRRIGERYMALLGQTPELAFQPARIETAENIYWVFGCVLADNVPFDAAEMMERLAKKGIGTRPFFWPMHEQPVMRRMGLFQDEHYPVSEHIARRGFYVPSGIGLTEEQIGRAAAAVKECLRS